MKDELTENIHRIIEESGEPYETKEIIEKLDCEGATRVKVLDRLKNLRGERKIEGKRVGPGKGAWIWWSD